METRTGGKRELYATDDFGSIKNIYKKVILSTLGYEAKYDIYLCDVINKSDNAGVSARWQEISTANRQIEGLLKTYRVIPSKDCTL